MMKLPVYTKLLILCTGVLLLSAFTIAQQRNVPKRMEPVQYVNWVESTSSGLHAKKSFEEFDLILKYRPKDYVIIKDHRDGMPDKKQWKVEKENMVDVQYFSFFIALNNGKKNVMKYLADRDNVSAQEVAKYLSYGIQQDLKLIQGMDTLDCKFLHFEETYEITPYARFLIAFEDADHEKRKIQYDKTLLVSLPWIEEKQIRLNIDKEVIQDLPKVLVKK